MRRDVPPVSRSPCSGAGVICRLPGYSSAQWASTCDRSLSAPRGGALEHSGSGQSGRGHAMMQLIPSARCLFPVISVSRLKAVPVVMSSASAGRTRYGADWTFLLSDTPLGPVTDSWVMLAALVRGRIPSLWRHDRTPAPALSIHLLNTRWEDVAARHCARLMGFAFRACRRQNADHHRGWA